MKKSKHTFTLLLSVFLFNCEDQSDLTLDNLSGEYQGTFTVVYIDGSTYSNPVTVTFSGNSYNCSAGTNRFPAGGNGSFEIIENKVHFLDSNFWTADFDWNLILTGEYELTGTDSIPTLQADRSSIGSYTYELVKQ